mmetsp:Transcript_57355/g.92942  ORF Transcript_57355/g.92942 Transcript_57355/m.92942 type:complete len:209 (-) Transcript_57355:117-743(-)
MLNPGAAFSKGVHRPPLGFLATRPLAHLVAVQEPVRQLAPAAPQRKSLEALVFQEPSRPQRIRRPRCPPQSCTAVTPEATQVHGTNAFQRTQSGHEGRSRFVEPGRDRRVSQIRGHPAGRCWALRPGEVGWLRANTSRREEHRKPLGTAQAGQAHSEKWLEPSPAQPVQTPGRCQYHAKEKSHLREPRYSRAAIAEGQKLLGRFAARW